MPTLTLPLFRMVSIIAKAEAWEHVTSRAVALIVVDFVLFPQVSVKTKKPRVTFQALPSSLPLKTWCSSLPRRPHSVSPRGLDYCCSSPGPAAASNSQQQQTCVHTCGSVGQGGWRHHLHPTRDRRVNRKGTRVTYCAWKGTKEGQDGEWNTNPLD